MKNLFWLILVVALVAGCAKEQAPENAPEKTSSAVPAPSASTPAPVPATSSPSVSGGGGTVAGTPYVPTGAGGATPVQPLDGGSGGYGAGQVAKDRAKSAASAAGSSSLSQGGGEN